MKLRQITFDEYTNPCGTYTITINNARFHEKFSKNIIELLKYFLGENECFWGFYRTDGIYLTRKQEEELEKVIPTLFKKHGEIEYQTKYLSVAKTLMSDYIYNYIHLIFDYYYETIIFCSKLNWSKFKRYHLDYQKHANYDLIIDNFTEMLFYYSDSGDFSICFNSHVYDIEEIRGIVYELFEKTGDG